MRPVANLGVVWRCRKEKAGPGSICVERHCHETAAALS